MSIKDLSTSATQLASGTTAQRPASPTVGQVRYNSTTGYAEVYTPSGWGIFGALPPAITTVSPTSYSGEQGTTFTINGSNFTSDATVKFIINTGTEYTASVVTYVNSGTLTATTPQDFTVAQEPLDVKVVQASGTATAIDAIDCGNIPNWTTASGSVWDNADDTNISTAIVATDPDSGGSIASYSALNLPAFASIASNGAITGTPNSVVGATTYNFTGYATDNAGNENNRAFSIIIRPTVPTPASYPLSPANYQLFTTGWTGSSADLYNLSHAASTFRVPANVYSLRVCIWGSGGVTTSGTSGNGGFIDAIVRVNPLEYYKVIVAGATATQSGGWSSSGPRAATGLGGGCSQDGNDVAAGGAGSGFFYAATTGGTTITNEATMFGRCVLVAGGGGGGNSPAGGGGNAGGSATSITIAGVNGYGIAGGNGSGVSTSNGGKANGSGGDMVQQNNTVGAAGGLRGYGGVFAYDAYGSNHGGGSGGGGGAGAAGGGNSNAGTSNINGENATGDGGKGSIPYQNVYNDAGPGLGGYGVPGGYSGSGGGNGFRFNGINLGGGGGGSHGSCSAGGGWGGGGGGYYAMGGGGGSGCAFGYLSDSSPILSAWVNPNAVTVNGGNAASVFGMATTYGQARNNYVGTGYTGAVLVMW